jgi:hypothetical protein
LAAELNPLVGAIGLAMGWPKAARPRRRPLQNPCLAISVQLLDQDGRTYYRRGGGI